MPSKRFSDLYRRLYPRVLGYAMRRVAADRAREVVDETFLIAWRRRADLPDVPLPWLFVTARNLIAEQVRRGLRQDAVAVELARLVAPVNGVGADVAAVERMTVLRALERLSVRDREALMLTVWDGLAHREAAMVAGCSAATFTVRLHRARHRLAAAMTELNEVQAGKPAASRTHQAHAGGDIAMRITSKGAVERMARQRFPSDEQLRELQQGHQPSWLFDQVSESLSEASAGAGSRVHGRRRALVSAGVAAIAVVGAVIAVPKLMAPPDYVATPPLLQYASISMEGSASDMLTELADKARRQPPPPGTGRYHYVHTRVWLLHTDRTTDMRIIDTGVQEGQREQWIAADGSGRIEHTIGGERTRWSGTYGPGQGAAPRLEGSNEDSLRSQLLRQGRGHTTGDWFDTVGQLWSQQVVTPQLQSALLRVLADQPGIAMAGMTTDRAGREGVAVSTEIEQTHPIVPEMRYVLVFDQDTGMLLDYEQIALRAGHFPIQAPATIGYYLWIGSGYTPDTTTRP